MNKFRSQILSLFLIVSLNIIYAQAPFSRGVNLTGWWFQTSNVREIQFSKYSKKDFQNIKSLGCDVIRLPMNLFNYTNGSPEYTIDPLFFDFLDQVVNWAEDLQLYLILDNHSPDDIASRNPNLQTVLTKVWAQMASHYKDRSTYIFYEILNEPNGITTASWGAIQQAAINSIRAIDSKHTIIVGPSGYNAFNQLSLLPYYTDSKLLYTFHFYDPFLFTHQGASWASPSLSSLVGVPFPYNAATMPSLPADLVGTWVAGSLNNYYNDGTVNKVKSLIDMAVDFKNTRNVNVYCGEFGVYNLNSNNNDRVYWYGQVRNYLESKGIPWTTWDYQGGFGIFNKGSNELFNSDLNIPLLNALGLNTPSQQAYVLRPDSVGFNIYTDYTGENITDASNKSGGTIDFYSNINPNNGKYCLFWNATGQYGNIGFNFGFNKDLSNLVSKNFALSLMVKGDTQGASFDLRFTDTKTGSTDHPWRMNYTVNESIVAWDGKWHKLYIPLTEFLEGGSWDGSWYYPIGAFDWKAVDRFDIVAEQASLVGKSFWFDNIQISNIDSSKISAVVQLESTTFKDKVYPNPFSQSLSVELNLPESEEIEANLFDITGKKILFLFKEKMAQGKHVLKFDNVNIISKGTYIIVVSSKNFQNKYLILKK